MTEARNHDEGAACLCMATHSPAPLEFEWHHIWPLYLGGPDTKVGVEGENGVWVCPTTHTNVHELLRLILKGEVTTYTQAVALYDQPVSRYAWRLAQDGVDRWRRSLTAL